MLPAARRGYTRAMTSACLLARRPVLRGLVLAAVIGAIAFTLRTLVIEPASIAHACDPAPWHGACAARTALMRSFVHQEIGWAGLAAGVLATVLRGRRTAAAALALGAAGLVLYSHEPAAVGALLGLLVLVRASAHAPSTAISAA
jgi:hypothetical protein